MLTLMSSPDLMKSGTWTTRPVSVVAGFCTLLAVSPLIPSELSVIFRVTEEGMSMVTGATRTRGQLAVSGFGMRSRGTASFQSVSSPPVTSRIFWMNSMVEATSVEP